MHKLSATAAYYSFWWLWWNILSFACDQCWNSLIQANTLFNINEPASTWNSLRIMNIVHNLCNNTKWSSKSTDFLCAKNKKEVQVFYTNLVNIIYTLRKNCTRLYLLGVIRIVSNGVAENSIILGKFNWYQVNEPVWVVHCAVQPRQFITQNFWNIDESLRYFSLHSIRYR